MTSQEAEIVPVDALVLAGGVNRIRLYSGYHPGYKALLPFAGKPSIRYVLEALEGVPQVRGGVVVGPPELRDALGESGSWNLLPAGKTVMESLFSGLEHLREAPSVLCTTADLPLLRSDSVSGFLRSRDWRKGRGRSSGRSFPGRLSPAPSPARPRASTISATSASAMETSTSSTPGPPCGRSAGC